MGAALLEATAVKRINPMFGERVAAVLAEHGLSLRAARIRTGIDHVTLSDMATGYVPRLERVEQFARAFGLDVNEWRELAGYSRMEAELTGRAIYELGVDAARRRFGKPVPMNHDEDALDAMNPEDAFQEVFELWKLGEEGEL